MCPHHQAVRGRKGGLSIQHVYPDNTLARLRRTCVVKDRVQRETGGSQAFVRRRHLQMRDIPNQLPQASEWRRHLRRYPHPLSPLLHLCKTGRTGSSTNQQAAPRNSPRLSPHIRLRRATPALDSPPLSPPRSPLPHFRPGGLVD